MPPRRYDMVWFGPVGPSVAMLSTYLIFDSGGQNFMQVIAGDLRV